MSSLRWLETASGLTAAAAAAVATLLLVFAPPPALRWIDVTVLGLTLVAGLGAALGTYQHGQCDRRSGLLVVGIAALLALASAVLSALGVLFVAVALLVLIAALLGTAAEFPRAPYPNRMVLFTAFALITGLLVGAIVLALWVVIPRHPAVTVTPYPRPAGVPMVPPPPYFGNLTREQLDYFHHLPACTRPSEVWPSPIPNLNGCSQPPGEESTRPEPPLPWDVADSYLSWPS